MKQHSVADETETRPKPGRRWPASHARYARVLVSLPPDVLAALDALAEQWGTSRSGAIVRAVEEARK